MRGVLFAIIALVFGTCIFAQSNEIRYEYQLATKSYGSQERCCRDYKKQLECLVYVLDADVQVYTRTSYVIRVESVANYEPVIRTCFSDVDDITLHVRSCFGSTYTEYEVSVVEPYRKVSNSVFCPEETAGWGSVNNK